MPSPHPRWLALFLTRREVGYLRCLAGPVSSEDWRCSCLCSELIPSVIERSALFKKELSFPHMAPTDDDFFQPDRAGACWDRWAGPGLLLGWFASSDVALPCKKKKKKGRLGVRS